MLRRVTLLLGAWLLCCLVGSAYVASADADPRPDCTAELASKNFGAEASVACPGSGDVSDDVGGSGGGCFSRTGEEVACVREGLWWHGGHQMWCGVMKPRPSDDDPIWDGHRNGKEEPMGGFMECTAFKGNAKMYYWVPELPVFQSRGYQEALYSVQSLQLHRPVVGVGAYVYPDEPWWGLTWWVGAPMWLWIDSKDPLQWGTHTLNPSAGGLSLDVTITAKQVRYDPGDGSRPVVCNNAGTPRPWAPDDLMRQDSPTWCQHKYLKTSELGNVDSRYVISATVVWDVVWSASDGDYGRFTVEMTSVDDPSVHVGELVAVIVPDPRRQKPTSTPT